MFDDCVALIHEAGLNADAWQDAVNRISAVMATPKVLLISGAIGRFEGRWAREIDEATFATTDPALYRPENNAALRAALRPPEGAVFDRREFVTDDGMDRHPVATDFFRPNRMFHVYVATAQKDADSAGILIAARERAASAFETADAARMRLLARHVGQAVRTNRALQLAEARGLAFSQALERLAQGVMLLDGRLRVLHANAAAEAMLDERRVLARRMGRLVLGEPRAQHALEAAARRLAGPDPERGETRIEVARAGRRPVTITLLPALGEASALAPRAQLLALVADPERGPEPGISLAQAFGLTPAEARVAALAASAAPRREIAIRLGLTENTVKSHLKMVYLKCGARDRAELVRRVLSQTDS